MNDSDDYSEDDDDYSYSSDDLDDILDKYDSDGELMDISLIKPAKEKSRQPRPETPETPEPPSPRSDLDLQSIFASIREARELIGRDETREIEDELVPTPPPATELIKVGKWLSVINSDYEHFSFTLYRLEKRKWVPLTPLYLRAILYFASNHENPRQIYEYYMGFDELLWISRHRKEKDHYIVHSYNKLTKKHMKYICKMHNRDHDLVDLYSDLPPSISLTLDKTDVCTAVGKSKGVVSKYDNSVCHSYHSSPHIEECDYEID